MIMQVATPQVELWRIEGAYSNHPHDHEDEFQITVPLYGRCEFTQDNRLYRLADGSGLVQHPQQRHYFEIDAQSGILICKIAKRSLNEFGMQEDAEFDAAQRFDPVFLREKFRKWMNALLNSDMRDGGHAEEEVEMQVLAYFLDAMTGSHRLNRRSVPAAPAQMRTVLEYIRDHYRDPIRIDTLASMAYQSRYHFIRSFKKEIGVTPYQYVLQLRMEEARQLLRQTDKSITDISFGLGFASVSQFQRAFARTMGVPPKAYRESCRA
jgi:AraC-type DNA-binding domain-containing proteins